MEHRYRNYFQEIFISEHDMECLQARFESNPGIRTLTKRILSAKDKMSKILDKQGISVWLTLEEMINMREAESEAFHFNLGFQHGHRAGKASALRILKEDGDSDYAVFSDRIRHLVAKASLPEALCIAALAENAWALALDALEGVFSE